MGVTLRKNVVVVGAGASKEFGLPTGAELTAKIAKIVDVRFNNFGSRLVSGDHRIVETLRMIPSDVGEQRRDINPFLHAGWKIRDNMSLAPSIDNFLDTHKENQEIIQFGKIAIVHAIQSAERQSSLFVDPYDGRGSLRLESLKETWMVKLFRILVAQRNFEDFILALQNITFVSFNYDRCIYQFFFYASRQYFDLSAEGVKKLMAALDIVYPYGAVGDFAFANPLGNQTNFGSLEYHQSLLASAEKIRTFTEGSQAERIKEIRKKFEAAEVVMFLGFGFLPLNMELLVGSETFEVDRILATGKGLSQASRAAVMSELGKSFFERGDYLGYNADETVAERVYLVDKTCGELFYEFERYLIR